ncbi:MAG: hypothetical protein Kow0092_09560 [Deferrisomatales bacterium]
MIESAPATRSLEELAAALGGLPELSGWPALPRWRGALELALLRRQLPPDAPLLTVVAGPTGVGKSTVFNRLLGRNASATGAIRPTTCRPLAVAPGEARAALREDPALAATIPPLEWVPEGQDPRFLGRQALVDAPDFDSVTEANRATARALIRRADRVLLVLSPEKYADASVWETVEELEPLGNLVGCVFNKCRGGEALEDCTRLLSEAGLPPPLIVPWTEAPDEPARWDPAERVCLRAPVPPPEDPALELAHRARAVEGWEARLRRRDIEPWILSVHEALAELERRLACLEAEIPGTVRGRLKLALDEAITRELQERFLESVQRYDLLREPRKWIGAPLRWLGDRLRLTGEPAPSPAGQPPPTEKWLLDGYLDPYWELLVELEEQLRALAGETFQAVEPALFWPPIAGPDREEAARDLHGAFAELQGELERETARIAQGISTAGKVRFYGSQALLQALLLTVFVHTGGGLTVGELAAQGLISPYGAKLFARLVSTGEASAVQRRLEGFLADRIAQQAARRIEPLRDQARKLRRQVGTPWEWRDAAARWDAEGDHDAAP